MWDKTVEYKVASMYKKREILRDNLEKFYPYRVRVFAWLLNKSAILPRDRLQARGWQGPGPGRCILCYKNIENMNYIFFECPYTTQLWQHIHIRVSKLQNMEIIRNAEGIWRVAKWGMGRINKRNLFNIRSMLMVVIWNIWLERNRRIFNNAQLNTIALLAQVEDNIVSWTGTTAEEAVAGSSTRPTLRKVRSGKSSGGGKGSNRSRTQ